MDESERVNQRLVESESVMNTASRLSGLSKGSPAIGPTASVGIHPEFGYERVPAQVLRREKEGAHLARARAMGYIYIDMEYLRQCGISTVLGNIAVYNPNLLLTPSDHHA